MGEFDFFSTNHACHGLCVCIQYSAVGAAMWPHVCVLCRLSLCILSQQYQRRVKKDYYTICVCMHSRK